MSSIRAFKQLETIRHRLPENTHFVSKPKYHTSILELAPNFDYFFFDAFGVLNVGASAIPGAIDAVSTLREMGKHVFVLSNAASLSKPHMIQRFTKLGFDFSADEIITSRDAVLLALADQPKNKLWGIIGLDHGQEDLDDLPLRYLFQDDPDFLTAPDGYLFLATARWNDDKQEKWLQALRQNPRTIILGNPDLIAPMGGHSSIEPGSYVLLLEEKLFSYVIPCGKPFHSIFAIAEQRLQKKGIKIDKTRTIMCGDTLHTDILGANAFDIVSALLTDHGFFKGLDEQYYINACGIAPHFILPQL